MLLNFKLKIEQLWKAGGSFIFVNLLVVGLGFFRSLAYTSFFNFEELGTITLVNTIFSGIFFFQFGLLNGGNRIVALQQKEKVEQTNNIIFSFFLIISTLMVCAWGVLAYLNILQTALYETLVAICLGCLNLWTGWILIMFISAREYNKVNFVNILAAILSLAAIPLAYYYSIWGAIIGIGIQPIVIINSTMILCPEKLPKKISFNLKATRYILHYGFVPFLSGIFFLGYSQVERWSINYVLGVEGLGKLYLFFLVIMLWELVPKNINSLYFPRFMQSFDNGENGLRILKHYILILAFICVLGTLIVVYILPITINYFYPQYIDYTYILKYIVIGLIFKTLTDPFGMFLNTRKKMKHIFLSDLISFTIYTSSILICINLNYPIDIIFFVWVFILYTVVRFILILSSFISQTYKNTLYAAQL